VTTNVSYPSSHWQLAWAQLQSAKYQAPKAKARARRKEVGLDIDFSTTLFG
jgi:hypothetical protein